MITLAFATSGLIGKPEIMAFVVIACIWAICYVAPDDSEWNDTEL